MAVADTVADTDAVDDADTCAYAVEDTCLVAVAVTNTDAVAERVTYAVAATDAVKDTYAVSAIGSFATNTFVNSQLHCS